MTREDVIAALKKDHLGAIILVVEDEPINQTILRHMLSQLGFQVALANNGEEAIEQARTQPYHLILLDIHMPVLGGLEAAPRLRALPTNACTPILAVTADTGDEERAAFLAAGMNDCLEKPIAQDALYRMCLHWLSAKRM